MANTTNMIALLKKFPRLLRAAAARAVSLVARRPGAPTPAQKAVLMHWIPYGTFIAFCGQSEPAKWTAYWEHLGHDADRYCQRCRRNGATMHLRHELGAR